MCDLDIQTALVNELAVPGDASNNISNEEHSMFEKMQQIRFYAIF